jgi:RNA polymerase sigma-70 factor (ECF subfamily)
MHSAAAIHPSFWKSSFEQHGTAVLAFLTSRLGRRELAEDLLQETFVRAIKARGLRDLSKVRSYLFSTAHRLVLDEARRRRPVLFSEISGDEFPIQLEDRKTPSPDSVAETGLIEERLQEALEELSPTLRLAFRAAVLEQKPYTEIGSEQGWTPGQVRVNVHRARKQVIAHMRDLLQLDEGEQP